MTLSSEDLTYVRGVKQRVHDGVPWAIDDLHDWWDKWGTDVLDELEQLRTENDQQEKNAVSIRAQLTRLDEALGEKDAEITRLREALTTLLEAVHECIDSEGYIMSLMADDIERAHGALAGGA